jgi:pyruvate kinase
MDCARLNFSHGDHKDHALVAKTLREVAARAGRPLAILADLSGPKMRIGRFPGGPIELVTGRPFVLTTRDVAGDENIVSVTYKQLPRDVRPGEPILLDDGLLQLRVKKVDGEDVHTEVEVGGTLSNNKGLNMPGSALSAPALTAKDKVDAAFAVNDLKVDYLALSFVRMAEDVREAQQLANGIPVIAKIEMPQAITNLDAILDAAEGAMVARGDLGVELGSERVPVVQKRIIREVNRRGKLVITATQMLDSMMRNPRPTRAEAADVANAVLDGTDAVMLSGETASGAYPVESVRMMDAIVRDVESARLTDPLQGITSPKLSSKDWDFSSAAARAAALLSFTLPLKAIVILTRDGRSADMLSEYRPACPIVAVTPQVTAANRLALAWGVMPRLGLPAEDLEDTLAIATTVLTREKICVPGDAFALVVGWPTSSNTNTVKLHRL